ncbi:platelet glycoprotein Ib alpha chain [Electrophorus electricus]|uniref:platelet glycoprotein Ib alpha chain n=1 Tax=Electrophorus electricus TaxID=8005 RepID=UPI0015CF963A|nr:platelet glycoprotein Ib alpha chain [Electrophorus electricus]
MLLVFSLVFLISRCFVIISSNCHSDRNKDHRTHVSCVAQSLSTVPDGIDVRTEVLDFTQNQFRSLSWADYSAFTYLYELDLSENNINVISPQGPVLGNLSVLRLSNNSLEGLGGRVFTSAPRLMEVYLDGNNLRSLHDATFGDLPHLEVINLSRNQLHALPQRLLECVSSTRLKTFDLEDNRVQLMPNEFFSSKPDLPYVFLSQNPWQCSCEVGYLQRYLEDQGHNVYQNTGPTTLENNPESVVCAGPPHLKAMAIVDLKEEDYCMSTKMTTTTPMTTPTTTPIDTTTNTPTSTFMATPIWHLKSFVMGDTDVWNNAHTTHSTTQMISTATQMISTATPTKTTWFEHWILQWNSSHLTGTTYHPVASTDRQKPSTAPTTPTDRLGSSIPPVPTPVQIAPGVLDSMVRPSERLGPWCWWLFAGFLPLCVLSGICCCMLFLWLVLTYSTLYRPLRGQSAALNGGVRLHAYRPMDGGGAPSREPESVVFLPPEKIRETQTVFRSVLFISKGQEDEGVKNQDERQTRGNDITAKTELRPVVEEDGLGASLQRERGRAGQIDTKEVFRKTLYRMICSEEEIAGWREVEERGKTRYSLILREERGSLAEDRKGEMEWLVGEWEMGGEL